MDRCAVHGQRTFCSELQGEDKAVIEQQVYFWALNGLVPILQWSRSSWMIFTTLKPDCSISSWTAPIVFNFSPAIRPSLCFVFDLPTTPFPRFVFMLCLHSFNRVSLDGRGCIRNCSIFKLLFFFFTVPLLTSTSHEPPPLILPVPFMCDHAFGIRLGK